MDIEDILHKNPSDVDPKEGMLLVAAPMMQDPHFRRSAILILDREKDGSHMGLVLNRRTEATLGMLLDDWPGADKIALYNGGPVELDRLFMLHRLGDTIEGSVELFPGIYSGGNADQIRDYIAAGGTVEGKLRFFLGYSGWAAGQLTKELMESTWAVNTTPKVTTLLETEGLAFWQREVRNLGDDYRSWLNIPEHPSLN